tara:strand:+ start:73 stop:855 length:783 start_codon:yes stop_codon:yes gene_type:complete
MTSHDRKEKIVQFLSLKWKEWKADWKEDWRYKLTPLYALLFIVSLLLLSNLWDDGEPAPDQEPIPSESLQECAQNAWYSEGKFEEWIELEDAFQIVAHTFFSSSPSARTQVPTLLSENTPPFVQEYLDTRPSIFTIYRDAVEGKEDEIRLWEIGINLQRNSFSQPLCEDNDDLAEALVGLNTAIVERLRLDLSNHNELIIHYQSGDNEKYQRNIDLFYQGNIELAGLVRDKKAYICNVFLPRLGDSQPKRGAFYWEGPDC